ncbi:MAG: bifunctional nuclease family protein [Candidatus Limnocylindria bacterium]
MLVPCAVESVRVHVLTGQHVVLLQPRDSERLLPIWIGSDQAHSIATRLAGVVSERPLTHDLITSMLQKVGVEITRVVVKDLVDAGDGNGVFHGSIFLQTPGGEIEVDSRASDAIALAIRCDARILVAQAVLDRSSIKPNGGEGEEGDISVFKSFIETLPDEPGPTTSG